MADNSHFRALGRRTVSLRGTLEATGSGVRGSVRVVDLGLGGARVTLELPPRPGTPVRLAVEAPHRWEPLTLDGHVAWVDDGEAGIAFQTESGATLRALVELLGADAYS